jgi:NADPH-dependent 2,4-dienoyl-CoA reductase/sulfur reductase-like enzyme
LRAGHYEGRIILLGEESRRPYDRPPLSKQVLAGTWEPSRTTLLSDRRVAALDLDVRLGSRAESVDLDARIVRTALGEDVLFDALVVTTGLRPRTIPGADGLEGVHVLRTLDHALALNASLVPDAELVVIGAGFLGLEVAATARSSGVNVTVVEPLAAPLENRIGPLAASRLLELHRSRGVRILTEVGVDSLDAAPTEGATRRHIDSVTLTDGTVLPATAVLVAVGCIPNTEFLASSGLEIADGVVCDAYCAAGPSIWAAGDVARWLHPGLGRHVRLEHRMNATEQANAVARNILGRGEPFAPVPFFWTDQYEAKIQVAGFVPPAGDGEIVESSDESFVQVFREEGRLVGVLGWNAAKALLPYRSELSAMVAA